MKFPILSLMLLLPQQVHPFAFTTQSSVRHDTRAFMSEESEAPEGDKHAPVDSYREGISAIKGKGSTGGPVQASKPKSVVMKFGGSSLATAERIDHVANLIKEQIELGFKPRAVVCSAMGKTTNTLLSAGDFALEGRVDVDALRTLHMAACNEFGLDETTSVRREVTELLDECESMLNGVRLLQELSPKSLDQLVSYGERCSVRIMAARLNQIGVPAQAFDSWEVGVYTDSNFGDAKLLDSAENEIGTVFKNRIDPSIVAVVTGFIGHDENGKITTLGRGGSDLTATAIGAACELDEIQVWKDVDGILSTDPRLVPAAVSIPDVSYDEASELAYFGAQVLHPIAMQPAMAKGVPVRVKNSYNPSHEGTVIRNRQHAERLVTAITCKRGVTLLDIRSTRMLGAYGFLATVFNTFEKNRISVDVLASSEISISVTLDKKQSSSAVESVLGDLAPVSDVTLKKDRAILTLITDVERSSEVLSTVFRCFSAQNIKVEMMSQGASKVNISFILKDDQLEKAITTLHACFFEDNCLLDPIDNFEEDTLVA
eukprot:CAMPEP_0178957680 /NCGR_PEP_ID=MMETSP0789-20121207/11078_1 /TAXON_ID=3005 /ORGANISM="Rhizosolenia setigera, Strain CCMP 1694" /LENGTH=543 /DNA_ID=CAMNT_0020640015 /DNA_START=78 /DNA_END=1709 /DNA_ORIENTATION=-